MAARLHLAGPDDLPRLLVLASAFRAEHGPPMAEARLAEVLQPLLDGLPHGAVYLVGPRRAPLGYIILSFGYSLEMGGIDGFLDEIYLRPQVRGRGLAREALGGLLEELSRAGMGAIHLEVDRDSPAGGLYTRLGFERRDRYCLMTRRLAG